jgi:phosphate starvation-inducible protein PhoH and related proteins
MNGFLRGLTTLVILNGANMFKISSRYSHTHSRTFFYNMKKETGDLKSLSNFYKPKTENQELYVKYLNDPSTKILFAVGPAGTGKTMLACNQAIKELKSGNIQKIVITRPVVPVEEEEIGFLPGNINKKMDPWTRPIFDIFYEFYQKRDVEAMLYNNIIEISPLAFMRGRTFKNAYIIADEMQNSSPNQMLMLTTRIGEGSKMVITGDLKQSDRGINSGLYDFINKHKTYTNYLNKIGNETRMGIDIVELSKNDIERNKVINKLLDIYEFNEFSVSKRDETPKSSQSQSSESVGKSVLKVTDNNDAALIPIHHMLGRVRE